MKQFLVKPNVEQQNGIISIHVDNIYITSVHRILTAITNRGWHSHLFIYLFLSGNWHWQHESIYSSPLFYCCSRILLEIDYRAMKLSKSVLSYVFVLLVTAAVAKNVFNPKFTENDVKNAVLEVEQKEFVLGKREAKNVIDLNLLYDNNLKLEKRNGKNIFATQLIIDDDKVNIGNLVKRDGKNIFDFNLLIDDASLYKRDGKNVFNINMIVDDDRLHKRDAKKVVNIHLIIDDDSLLVKRGIENIIDLSLSLPEEENFVTLIQDSKNMGFVIGKDEYTLDSYDRANEDVILKLKHNPEGCHNKKRILNIGSLSEVLETFKEKMVYPIMDSKDNVPIIDMSEETTNSDMHSTLWEPAKGDLASALAQRDDLALFAKYLRDFPHLYRKCETTQNENKTSSSNNQILIFAPTNQAITSLKYKPWQFPEDVASAESEDEEDKIILRNISNFVESHFVETENFNIASDSNTVEFETFNGNHIELANFNDNFRIRLKDSNQWLDVKSVEILENGAILSIDSTLARFF